MNVNKHPSKKFVFPTIRTFFLKHGQMLMNIYLFVAFSTFCGWQIWKTYLENRLDFIEISFAVQNLIMVALFLIRKKHVAFNKSIFDQAVALAAFLSGAAFIGQPLTAQSTSMMVSRIIILTANVLGVLTLLNLGRSFGVFIAIREIKTKWLYSIIRHPMYFTDILLRVGYLVSHFTLFTATAFVLSSCCYGYRAILEERFLSKDPAYRVYLNRVRYRFIPLIF